MATRCRRSLNEIVRSCDCGGKPDGDGEGDGLEVGAGVGLLVEEGVEEGAGDGEAPALFLGTGAAAWKSAALSSVSSPASSFAGSDPPVIFRSIA